MERNNLEKGLNVPFEVKSFFTITKFPMVSPFTLPLNSVFS